MFVMIKNVKTYLADICADFATLHKELNGSHPLIGRESRLPRKIMHVRRQPLHEVLETSIVALRIDPVDVRSDVVNSEVQQAVHDGNRRRETISIFLVSQV